MTGDKTFGQWLREYRIAERLTLSELGDMAGIDPAGINKVELGYRQPTYEFAVKIAAALGMNTDRVLELAGLKSKTGGRGDDQSDMEAAEICRIVARLPVDRREEAIRWLGAFAHMLERDRHR